MNPSPGYDTSEVFNRVVARVDNMGQSAVRLLESWGPTAVLVDMVRRTGADQVGDMAASVAYYAIFSLFPLLLGVIVVLSLVLEPARVEEELLAVTAQYLPGAETLISENIENVLRVPGAIGVVAIVGLLWSASGVFGSIARVLDRAWSVGQTHAFHIIRFRSILMVIGVAGLFLLSLVSSTLVQSAQLLEFDPFGVGGFLASSARTLLLGTSIAGSLAFPLLLYRFAPSERVPWREVVPAAILAGVFFEVAKGVFLFYLHSFAGFDRVYGSLSLVIVLLLWAYISALILILGAEFGGALGRWRQGVTQRAIAARNLGRG